MTDLSAHTTAIDTEIDTKNALTLLTYLQAYIQALSQELACPVPPTLPLLWVAQDDKHLAQMQSHLYPNSQYVSDDHASNTDQLPTESDDAPVISLSVLNARPILQRHQLVCFWLPSLTSNDITPYLPLLMRYRDLYAQHLIIALHHSIDLRAYGLAVLDIIDDNINDNIDEEQIEADTTLNTMTSVSTAPNPITLWQFNLYDYKKLPNWLNSDYWANPQNWNKNRW